MEILKENAQTFGDWGYLAIAKHYNKVMTHETGVLLDQDPEELHQMRVGMRRLRSAIAGFNIALDLSKPTREKKVAYIGRILGALRDIDVLQEIFENQYLSTLPSDEIKHLYQALLILQAKRDHAAAQVQALIKEDIYLKFKQGFQKWLKKPKYYQLADININYILPELLLSQVSKFLLHKGFLVGVKIENQEMIISEDYQLEKLLVQQGEIIHDLRKEAKKIRYQMELFIDFYEKKYCSHVEDIKLIQSILGDIQDSFVLNNFLTEVFGNDLEKKLPFLVEKLKENRYQKWLEWQKIQIRFLQMTKRKQLLTSVLSTSVKP